MFYNTCVYPLKYYGGFYMKQRRLNMKVILSVIATLLLVCALFGVTASADNVANYNRAYGQVVPTDSNLKAQVDKYDFYGDVGTLYFMQISKGKENANFAVEIYSDANYQNQVRSFTRPFAEKAGNTPLKVAWEFKDIPSGTYYGRCYTYVESVVDNETVKTIDSSSFSKFTINIQYPCCFRGSKQCKFAMHQNLDLISRPLFTEGTFSLIGWISVIYTVIIFFHKSGIEYCKFFQLGISLIFQKLHISGQIPTPEKVCGNPTGHICHTPQRH
jgi:hypothetical protein